jgi:hypothetical protein
MLGLILKTVVALVVCLVLADIAGALTVTFFDILPFRFVSAALAYAIWLVAGGFCGFFAYNFAGAWSSSQVGDADWSANPGARRTGTGVLVVGLLVVAGLVWLFDVLFWRQGVASDDDYVPDSLPHSAVFFVAVAGAMALSRFVLMPTPPAAAPPIVSGATDEGG